MPRATNAQGDEGLTSMFFAVDEATRARAKTPHELAMLNLLLCNLPIAAALLAGSMASPESAIARWRWVAAAIPLALSLALIALALWRAARPGTRPWFVAAHWRLSATRYRLVLGGYLLCGALLAVGLFSAPGGEDLSEQVRHLPPAMQEMERRKLESQDMGSAVWARIGVVPLLLGVMVTIMLESGSLYQASRGELPDGLVAAFPPPAGLVGRPQPES